MARAIASIVQDAGIHHGQVYELTGLACKVFLWLQAIFKILTFAKNGHGLAKILSKGLETEIHYQEISASEARDLLKSKNFSKEKVRLCKSFIIFR